MNRQLICIVVVLGAVSGLIAFGWTNVYAALARTAARDAGVDPRVYEACLEYDATIELTEMKQMLRFVASMRAAGMPRERLADQFADFCEDDTGRNTGREFAACHACFDVIVETVYRSQPATD